MSDTPNSCAHCWHVTGQYTDTVGRSETRKCCHCGLIETVRIPPPNLSGHTYTVPKHGPHVPPSIVQW